MANDDGTRKPSETGHVKYAVSPDALTKEAQGVEARDGHEPYCPSVEPLTSRPCPHCQAVKND